MFTGRLHPPNRMKKKLSEKERKKKEIARECKNEKEPNKTINDNRKMWHVMHQTMNSKKKTQNKNSSNFT